MNYYYYYYNTNEISMKPFLHSGFSKENIVGYFTSVGKLFFTS